MMTTFLRDSEECSETLYKPSRILQESGAFCHGSSAGKRNPRFKVRNLRHQDGSLNSQEMPAEATM
jgi:hypothetical protein